MNDQKSAFNLENAVQSVGETLTFLPMNDSATTMKNVGDTFSDRFASDGQSVDTGDDSVVLTLERCGVELIESAVSIVTMTLNQLNINYSVGSTLDSIASLFRITRKCDIATRVLCRFWGQKNTLVPQNNTVTDDDGHSFVVESPVTISVAAPAGSASPSPYYGDGYVECTERGEIQVATGAISKISTGVLGWESVENIAAGEAGQDVEDDYQFRKRVKTCRYNGISYAESIRSRISAVDGVRNVYIGDNGTSGTIFVDDDGTTYEASERTVGNTDPAILPHGVLIIVDGGLANDVANAIFETLSDGCDLTPLYTHDGTYEANSYVIVDGVKENSYVKRVTVRESVNSINHVITYNVGETVPFKVKATVIRNTWKGTTSELVKAVKQAVDSWQSGSSPYVDGLSLGDAVYKYEVSAAISDAIPEIQVKDVSLYTHPSGSTTLWQEVSGSAIDVRVYEKAVSNMSDNEVYIYGETN